ncbi:hypothetical protein KM043_013299 [Ampulex compressa]|nr:hypothetical protein KM043_013299 [Ampulex compressa]
MEVEKSEQTQNSMEAENNIVQLELESKCDKYTEGEVICKDIESSDVSAGKSFITLPEASTSHGNSLTSLNNIVLDTCSNDVKVRRTISKGETNGDSGISMENAGNSSDEDSGKRQKLNGNTPTENIEADDLVENSADNDAPIEESGSTQENIADDDASPLNVEMDDDGSTNGVDRCERGLELSSDIPDEEEAGEEDPNEWTTASEDELDEKMDEEVPSCLKKEKPNPNWCVVHEVLNRQMGNNPLFQRRFYGSLHAVERLELMYKLNEHEGCVNALNFNQKGNLLASGSDDLAVVIWDWAIGKKHICFDSGHRSNMFQVKWLPFDVEYLMATCARDGQVRLLDIRRGTSRKLVTHHAGEDAKVYSIDIRENKPTKLLIVRDSSSAIQLYSVHSNPLNSNQFCVGGRSQAVRIYDRRKVSTPIYKLCPDHLVGNKHVHVTSAVYNYNGTEVVASYNDENIYLFDTVMPQTGDFAHRYQGHRNNATVKAVNFFGPKSEFVISGSDCGNIFIWDKNTEAIVQWMEGDEQGVVNCLEGHPHVPILATSGLDYDVKIWIPSCEQPPLMADLEKCVKSNVINRAQDSAFDPGAFDGQMLWILLSHIRHTERNFNATRGSADRSRDDDDEDDADDSSNDNGSSDRSDSQSEGDMITRLHCPPS